MSHKHPSSGSKAKLIVLFLLVLALPVFVVLAQYVQDVRQKAAVSNSKLGVFALGPCTQYDTVVNGGPKIMKIAVGTDVHSGFKDLMRRYKQRNPDGILVFRVYDNNPNNFRATDDPAASARNYYNTYIAAAWNNMSSSDRALVDYIAGDNELSAFDAGGSLYFDSAQSWNWYGRFWQELAAQIRDNTGKKPLMGEWGVGHPVNTSYINEVLPAMRYVRDIGGAWSYHTYTRDYTTDVNHERDRDSLRYRQYLSILSSNGVGNLKWIMGEAGVDKHGGPTDGWRDRGDANKYQQWLQWFDGQMKQDSAVIGATIFQLCDDGGAWRSFNIAPIADWFANYLGGTPTQPTTPPNQPTTPPGVPTIPPTPFPTNPPSNSSFHTGPIPKPTNLDHTCSIDARTVLLEWDADPNADHYLMNFNNESRPDIYSTDKRHYRYTTSVTPNKTYLWEVWGNNTTNDSPVSDKKSFTCKPPSNDDDDGGTGGGPTDPPEPTNTPRPTATPTPIPVANCINVQGPTTVRLGRTVVYLAQYTVPTGGRLSGQMNAAKIGPATQTDPAAWDWRGTGTPAVVRGEGQVLRFAWTPTEVGAYQVFCQAWNDASGTECRGAPNTVSGGLVSQCKGPQAVITVNVVTEDVPTGAVADMCQFATAIGSDTLTPYRPIAISAVAKPSYNIKHYTFAFYNADNASKPIHFEAGRPYLIESAGNTVTIDYTLLGRIDRQTGQIPKNLLVKAFLTDIAGNLSIESNNCSIPLKLDGTPLQPTSAPTLAPTFAPTPDRPGAIGGIGALLFGGIILVAFFVKRDEKNLFTWRRRR